ncbi:MAG: sortase B protein-sorting domain-containing protein [Saprospiraceae bacterium]|nr:sortase B protein-sorting domain-containing protein [Saprospiraceae bacterium]MBK8852437.1 sortase B protein-sorting domain-containing protein [Saprospiraceae bacterium]
MYSPIFLFILLFACSVILFICN